jgi:L-cysteine desulfidase
MNSLLSIHWVLIASLWYFINGVLHSIVVLKNHKGDYDRELLRLLMVGHLLIFSGLILFVSYLMVLNKIQCGATIAIITAASMLVFCAMIFPFLKSFGTIIISLLVIIVCLRAHRSFPNIYEIMKNYK